MGDKIVRRRFLNGQCGALYNNIPSKSGGVHPKASSSLNSYLFICLLNAPKMLKLELIAAACENMGIGKNQSLPWRLKSEMDYFTRMTSTTVDSNLKNIVIMGRKTWDSIPEKYKPLHNRINFILTRSNINLEGYDDCFHFKSLESALKELKTFNYERVWIIGGSSVYEEAMKSKFFYRLYLTKILKHFDCDIFFPKLGDNLKEVRDPVVPEDEQEEKGIKFVYNVYENVNFGK